MDLLIILGFLVLVCIMNLMCMFIGLKVGLALKKGESFTLPNPIAEYAQRQTEKEAKKQAKAEQDMIQVILRNIENYDGTGFGQMDVPRG